ncbi:MAG: LamG domain-containing protein, partial [Victivallales bacterium]|nr:LamG domain-containing protein [Victivallales bacterium]
LIDEVRFFDDKLTPEEIKADYESNSGSMPPPPEPEAAVAFSFDKSLEPENGSATPAKIVRGTDKSAEALLMDGIAGKSLRIGRSQDGTVGQTTEYTITPALSAKNATVSFWVRANDWTPATSQEFQHFLGGFSKSERLVIYKYYQNSRVNVLLGPLAKGNAVARFDMKEWQPGTWHHICAAWTPTDLELYIDGVKVSQAKRTTPPGPTDFQRIQLGEMWSGNPGSSSIDELRIFDRKLSAAEIQLLYKRNAK